MRIERRNAFKDVRLLNIECDEPYDWDESGVSYIRVCLPVSLENQQAMREKGFVFADRTLGVSINLRRSNLDYKSMIRIKPELICNKKDEILQIAKESFPVDRRFQVALNYNDRIKDSVITGWVEELEEYYACSYKGQIIGFLALKDIGEGKAFVHLAAVMEKYRMTGAALSLYANAADICKSRGYSSLDGRISSFNVSVMNLYAALGAVFQAPMDVFLKEV